MDVDVITFKEFFMWMTVVNLILYTWTAVMCFTAKGWIQRVHGKMFGLAPETINAFLYGYLGVYKIVFIVFVLVPWITLTIIS